MAARQNCCRADAGYADLSQNGYGKIASRLRVLDGRLVIIPLEAFNEGQELSFIPDESYVSSYT